MLLKREDRLRKIGRNSFSII